MYVNLTGSAADMALLVAAFLAGAVAGAILVLISGKRIPGTPIAPIGQSDPTRDTSPSSSSSSSSR